ncbi:uncharacterized protein SOCE26_019410 [Sorangium cellulosum]|uniref:DUF4386 domain-containing protein n=1 Tax=Sorangium cellulosum TaxID=56 RepID=A0A2L0EMM8_SORCE|nr:hypothetical protein [Sorangium cellulosum]AUX40540.1 uncharacterized protein SOCE26_019410 [Sorangium cellulosum]
MTDSNDPKAARGSIHQGPNPGIVAAVFMLLFLASLVPVTLLMGETHFPSPLQPPEEVVAYFRGDVGARVRACAFLQFAASIPLGILSATVVSRLRFHGTSAAGPSIAWFGGLAASAAMGLSALLQWSLAQPGIAESAALTRGMHYLIFAIGGPGYTVPLGLLLAGICVPALVMKLLPRWLAVSGLVLGVVGELSVVSLVIPGALFLIPLTRFPAFLWLIAAGFKLPRARSSP